MIEQADFDGIRRSTAAGLGWTSLEYDLRWATQFLTILHRDGFPSIEVAERALAAGDDLLPAAKEMVSGTRHLAHPSLTALRKRVEEA